MKKLLTIIVFLLSISATEAQIQKESHIDKLYEYVKILRTSPNRYDEVKKMMSSDNQWTMMTEFTYNCTDESVLCSWRDDFEYCALKDICYQIETARGTMTTNAADLFCNGNDPNYSYSIDELILKAGKQLQSSLSFREGRQHFLIVPYDYTTGTRKSGLSVTIKYQGINIPAQKTERGLEFIIDKVHSPDDVIDICITNTSLQNLSFIFINHNSRK